MDPEATVQVLLGQLQLGIGFGLLSSRRLPPAIRPIAWLTVVNASISLLAALDQSPLGLAGRLATALDVLTVPLLLSGLVLLLGVRIPVEVLVAVGLLHALAVFAWPELGPAGWPDTLFRALPWHLTLSIVLWTFASRPTAHRWVAIALLPHAAFYGTTVFVADWPSARSHELANLFGLAVLAVSTAAATLRLVRTSRGSTRTVVLCAAGCGVLVHLAVTLQAPAPTAVLPLITLGLARPILLQIGLEPDAAGLAIARPALAASFSVACAFVSSTFLLIPQGSALMLGLGLGILAQAILGRFMSAAAEEEPQRAQWELVLVALKGSSSAANGIGHEQWTQQGLARKTGLDVRRVSAFTNSLERQAARRLDAFLPGWRDRYPEAPPLVEKLRGTVAGRSGVWTWYRLTAAGEELTLAVERRRGLDSSDRPNAALSAEETRGTPEAH